MLTGMITVYITYITRFDGVYRPTLAINNSVKSTNCLSLQACRSPFPCLTFFREKRNKTPNNSKNLFQERFLVYLVPILVGSAMSYSFLKTDVLGASTSFLESLFHLIGTLWEKKYFRLFNLLRFL